MAQTASSPDFPCSARAIRDYAICATLNDDELATLARFTSEVKLKPGQVVFHEGDESTFLFNVVEGTVRLVKLLPNGKRQITGFLFPGDFLGLSVSGTYPYSAEAIEPAVLCRFRRSGFMEVVDTCPKLEHQLLALASNELIEAQEHMALLGRKDASERIATMLLKLSIRFGLTGNGKTVLDVPMSREDMADYLGLTLETVSRILGRLQRSGIIRLPEPRRIEILKPERLEEIAATS